MLKNGAYVISVNGTLGDFFDNMKTSILYVTDFQLILEECETLKLVFNTNINDIKMVIRDTAITSDTDTTTKSKSIQFAFYQNDVQLDTFNRDYASTVNVQSSIIDRQVNLFVYATTNFKFFDFSVTTSTFGYTFGKVITSEIATKSTKNRFFIKNIFYPFDGVGTKLYLINQFSSLNCENGIIKTNLLLNYNNGSPYSAVEYCNDLYNCSTVTSKYKYNINGEMYFAIDKNILVRV